ncbi:heparan sulfate 2-O-sulfotransferase 1 isoform X2 [Cimex lectularius]|uniref:Heparan sulfate 2-O-sulfotransferase n=1 Tax=Cimex lectularius TaxID=79782 RepID=A0A8I6THI0_CIMLE|nr:heparan sulfate 2-O-sulfotransferase 1 isoform X2 [Cimex lectularius]
MLFRPLNSGNGLFVFAVVLLLVFIGTFVQFKFVRLEENTAALEAKIARLQNAYNNQLAEEAKGHTLKRKASQNDILIYNRVPKTASTSLVNVAYDLCKRNGFNVLHLNITGNIRVMSIADQARFVHNVTHWEAKKPGLYHGHVAFIDFEKFGSSQRPIYINLLRKPLDRLISYYYFIRFGDNYRPHLIRRKHGDKMTFDECVKKKQPDCNPENMWLQIPFLCGHMPECWEVGNNWALEEAKKNLLTRYLLVGVTEQLSDFVAVLEATLPTFFRGAVQHFKSSKKAHLRRTNQKLEPSQETIDEIQKSKIWKMETELYEFAIAQFEDVKRRMGKGKDGLVYDKGQQFMYEKISPKQAVSF